MARDPRSLVTALLGASVLVAASLGTACEEPPHLRLAAPPLSLPAPPRRGADPSDAQCVARSLDPPPAVLDSAVAEAAAGAPEGYAALLGLALAWPRSATVRLRAAEAAQEPADALRLYADAVRVHDEGCALAPDALRAALHGLGAARLAAGDAPGARDVFTRAVDAFPEAAPTRYALAAAACRLHDRTACADALLAALAADTTGTLAPLAARDPDLTAARTDPRVSAALAARPAAR